MPHRDRRPARPAVCRPRPRPPRHPAPAPATVTERSWVCRVTCTTPWILSSGDVLCYEYIVQFGNAGPVCIVQFGNSGPVCTAPHRSEVTQLLMDWLPVAVCGYSLFRRIFIRGLIKALRYMYAIGCSTYLMASSEVSVRPFIPAQQISMINRMESLNFSKLLHLDGKCQTFALISNYFDLGSRSNPLHTANVKPTNVN